MAGLRGASGRTELVGPLQTFGVREILCGRMRREDATAAQPTRVLTLEAEDFFDLLANNIEIVRSLAVDRPDTSGHRDFSLRIPESPYSFSGKLITLSWAIELVALPSGETERLDLQIGPQPVEVDLR